MAAATVKGGRLPLAATCLGMIGTVSGSGRLLLIATCFAIALASRTAVWSQSPALTVVLTGQSMIRSDIRLYTPSAVATMSPLLHGDVVFTNFEATVAEPGQPNET